MATFCPTCGLENQPDRNFCRGCGTNLRVVKNALELGAAGELQIDHPQVMKKYVTDFLFRQVGELQLKRVRDLKRVVEQIGKLLESDEVQKLRHVRNGIIVVAVMAGAVCFFGLSFLAATGAPSGMLIGVLSIFLALIVPILLFMLYRLAKPLQQSGSLETKVPITSGEQIGLPQLTHQPPRSVTEHTTQQLGEMVRRPPQPEVAPPK